MDLSPEDVQRLTREAVGLLQAEQFAAAEAAAAQVLAACPEDVGVLHVLSITMERQGRMMEAAGMAMRAAELAPQQADRYARVATLLLHANEALQAEAVLRQGIGLCEPAATLHLTLSFVLERQERFEDAVIEAERALALDPANAHGLARLGRLLLVNLRRFAEAEAALRQAIALRADVAGFFDTLGLAMEWQERWVEAGEAMHAAWALEPANPQRCVRAGQMMMRGYAFDAAIAALQQGAARLPQVAALHDTLSQALQQAGRFDEATAALRAAIALEPAKAGLHLRLGHLLVRQDDLDAAEVAYRQAIALDAGQPQARERLDEVIAARAASGQAAGSYQPGSRPLTLLLVATEVGLGHLFVAILNCAYYAHRTGRRFAVDLRRFAYVKSNQHATFLENFGFEFPPELEVITDLAEIDRLKAEPDTHFLNLQERMDVTTPYASAVVFIPCNTPGAPYSLEVKEHDPSFRLVLKGRLKAEWDRAMSMPYWSGPVIGLHYRSTVGELTERSIKELVPDHGERVRAIEDSYIKAALAAAEAAGYENPAYLVASDDANFVAYVKERLPNSFSLATRLLDQEVIAYIRTQGHDIGILIDAINDLWCLASCDHLVHFRSAFTDFAKLNSRTLTRATTHYVHVPSFEEMLKEAAPGTAVIWARAVVRKADARRMQIDYWHVWLAGALERAGMTEAAALQRQRARWHWEVTQSEVADTPARLLRPGQVARGDFASVLADQQRMVAALPGNPYALSGYDHSLSGLLAVMGRMDEAIAVARQAIAIDPGDGYLHRHLGRLLLRQGDFDAAAAAFRCAAACDPDVAESYDELVDCLARQARSAVAA